MASITLAARKDTSDCMRRLFFGNFAVAITGAAMAVALITTMYGSMVANMFCIPFAGKLKERTKEEAVRKEMIIAGVLAIQNGDNPRIVQQKLLTYLPQAEREAFATDEE